MPQANLKDLLNQHEFLRTTILGIAHRDELNRQRWGEEGIQCCDVFISLHRNKILFIRHEDQKCIVRLKDAIKLIMGTKYLVRRLIMIGAL